MNLIILAIFISIGAVCLGGLFAFGMAITNKSIGINKKSTKTKRR